MPVVLATDYSQARWKALGKALRAQREEMGWRNRREFAGVAASAPQRNRIGSLSYTLLNDVERGAAGNITDQTINRIELQYCLAPGAVVEFLRNPRATRLQPAADDQAEPAAELSKAARDAILAELGLDRGELRSAISVLERIEAATQLPPAVVPMRSRRAAG